MKKLSPYQLMYRTIRLIDMEPYELSHEKIRQQRDWFKKLARETLQEIHKYDDEEAEEPTVS